MSAQGAATAPGRPPRNFLRFLCMFPLLAAAGFGLLQAPFIRPEVDQFTFGQVKISALIIRSVGGRALAQGKLLRNPVTGFEIAVEDTCNASNVVILLWSAVLAFPAGWRQKARGIGIGTLLLLAVNLVRIVSLFWLAQYRTSWFDFAHLYVWEGLMMVLTLVLFWAWVQESGRIRTGSTAPLVH